MPEATLPNPLSCPPGRIGGPIAWRASELRRDGGWIHRLTPADIAEIEAAADHSRSRKADILDITTEDFPLPGLAARMSALRRDVMVRYGFAYLRGLPVARYDRATLTRIYWGLSRHIGVPVPQSRDGHMIGHVVDAGISPDDMNKRLTQTNLALQFHSDACDVVGLLCVRTAMRGGESALVSFMAVHDEMRARRPDLCRALYAPLTCDRRGDIPAGKQPWMRIPLFMRHADSFTGYMPLVDYLESTSRFADAPATTPVQWEAIRMFLDLCNHPDFVMHLPFEPGDMQFVHNHVVLHARTAFEDWPESARRRHLVRIWLSLPDGRELPPALAERWIEITRGKIRGGFQVADRRKLTVPLAPAAG